MTLNELKPGEHGVISAVAESPDSKVLRDRLLDMGLTPKTPLFVRRRGGFVFGFDLCMV